MKHISLALLGCLIGTMPVRALAEEPDAFAEARRDALIEHASSLPGYGQISGVALEEMDGDRRLEAIVISAENCDPEYGCAWMAFSDAPEGWKTIGRGYAHEVSFHKPSGSENYLIDTDGVKWVYRGGKEIALSTGELARKRPLRPTEEDYAFLAEARPQFDDRAEMDLVRYEIDIDLDGEPETVLVIRGLRYGMGTSGRPYLILDGDRNILVDGATPDLPIIFPAEGAGVIVNPAPAGLQILELR